MLSVYDRPMCAVVISFENNCHMEQIDVKSIPLNRELPKLVHIDLLDSFEENCKTRMYKLKQVRPFCLRWYTIFFYRLSSSLILLTIYFSPFVLFVRHYCQIISKSSDTHFCTHLYTEVSILDYLILVLLVLQIP